MKLLKNKTAIVTGSALRARLTAMVIKAKAYNSNALIIHTIQTFPQVIFTNWLRSKGKLAGQHMVARLSNDRPYIDKIKLLLNV
jgi:hypothetical protein